MGYEQEEITALIIAKPGHRGSTGKYYLAQVLQWIPEGKPYEQQTHGAVILLPKGITLNVMDPGLARIKTVYEGKPGLLNGWIFGGFTRLQDESPELLKLVKKIQKGTVKTEER